MLAACVQQTDIGKQVAYFRVERIGDSDTSRKYLGQLIGFSDQKATVRLYLDGSEVTLDATEVFPANAVIREGLGFKVGQVVVGESDQWGGKPCQVVGVVSDFLMKEGRVTVMVGMNAHHIPAQALSLFHG